MFPDPVEGIPVAVFELVHVNVEPERLEVNAGILIESPGQNK
jgi:hypothetical protein